MTDAVRRALRTFAQAFIGTFILVAVPWATNIVTAIVNAKPYELDFNVLQSAGIAGVFAGGIAIVSWVQNALEDHGTVKPMLKNGDTTEAA
jgi:hypothetical protein